MVYLAYFRVKLKSSMVHNHQGQVLHLSQQIINAHLRSMTITVPILSFTLKLNSKSTTAWEKGKGKRKKSMREFTLAYDSLAVSSIQVSSLNDMVLGIHPVDAVASIINGETVGPEQMRICNDPSIGPIHVGILNAWSISPVRPIDLTGEENGKVTVSLLVYTLSCPPEAV